MEILGLEKVTVYCVDSDKRHELWVSNPNAKEITKKEFERIINYIKENK